jgi:hypothetical protein
MTDAAPITNADVSALLCANCIPRGYQYSLVMISFTKRMLAADRPAREKLEFLEHLEEPSVDHWLSLDMIKAVEPMCDKGFLLAAEALKLGDRGLDVLAQHFPTFAVLNPSLIKVLSLIPGAKPLRLAT